MLPQERQAYACAAPPQGGQTRPTDRAGISSSVARASLLALYHFYDPPQVPSARVLPERELPQALARALIAYGAASRTTWLLEDNGRISTDQAQLPQGTTPGQAPALGPACWYSTEATSDPSAIGSALRIPPTAKGWIGSDSTLRLYGGRRWTGDKEREARYLAAQAKGQVFELHS